MNEAVRQMLASYEIRTVQDSLWALREVMQEIALLGLWRGKFFEKAAFYGGTALRVLYGLDRYSEDLDFSLLKKRDGFDLADYSESLKRELASFGFAVEVESRTKQAQTAVQSAFLKADTRTQMITVEFGRGLVQQVPRNQVLKIKLEVDTDPPPGFSTEVRYLLRPVPFAVRTFALPDLFAGKMHAVLCRDWKSRVKGRDWYDLVWFAAHHPELRLSHLEQRMRQSGHWEGPAPLTEADLRGLLTRRIERVDIRQIRGEAERFLKDPGALALWSKEFFLDVVSRVKIL
ncbi:MAG: nucleotidyl transferase AbiEii/AbiGii toxin family protein [Candidatus Aminicenantes bacterium]|jgi:predicted nucleotidyltransferase component of viral defense system|nr:nucleotidyl transferase AbiEii/AbiGii toxin family protein [Candidatus Aminicenantes bacterium]